MSLVTIIYLIDVICEPWVGCGLIMAVTMLLGGFGLFYGFMEDDDRFKDSKIIKSMIIIPLIFGFLCNFIPSKQAAYAMLAAYGVEEVAAMPQVQSVASKSLLVLEKQMDKYLKEEDKSSDKD